MCFLLYFVLFFLFEIDNTLFIEFFETESHCLVQIGLELLGSPGYPQILYHFVWELIFLWRLQDN